MPPEIMETPPFPRIPSFPGDRASRPREGTFPRPPLAEFDGGAPSFAGGQLGQLCGAGVARSCGRGGSGGARVGRWPPKHINTE